MISFNYETEFSLENEQQISNWISSVISEEEFREGSYTTGYIKKVAPQERINTDVDFGSVYKKLAAAEARNMGM